MSVLSQGNTAADIMTEELEIMTAATHYRQWLYRQLRDHLGRRVLEIGSGIGNFTEMLLDREAVLTIDTNASFVAQVQKRFSSFPSVIARQGDIADPASKDLAWFAPDTIVCVNVLEHVRDDHAALVHMREILAPGGAIALLVPAFPAAYGSIDRLVGHFRRYRKGDLRRRLAAAGFVVSRMWYMNSIGLLGWFVNNRVLKQRGHSRSQVLFYDTWVIPWLSGIERILRPPFGLSLVALARKESR